MQKNIIKITDRTLKVYLNEVNLLWSALFLTGGGLNEMEQKNG